MMSTYCLRLASRPATVRASTQALSGPIWVVNRSQQRVFQRLKSTKVSRFAEEEKDESSTASPFKLQRQKELKEAKEADGSLFSEAYPRLPSSETRTSIPEFVESFDDLPASPVTVSGRVRAKRQSGKFLTFVDIVNEFQKVQVMINKKTVCKDGDAPSLQQEQFMLFNNLIQVGDHVCTLCLLHFSSLHPSPF